MTSHSKTKARPCRRPAPRPRQGHCHPHHGTATVSPRYYDEPHIITASHQSSRTISFVFRTTAPLSCASWPSQKARPLPVTNLSIHHLVVATYSSSICQLFLDTFVYTGALWNTSSLRSRGPAVSSSRSLAPLVPMTKLTGLSRGNKNLDN